MFYIILIIVCIIVFFWLKNKFFVSKEEDRLNKHDKLNQAERNIKNNFESKK